MLFVIDFFGCYIFTKYEYIALQQSVLNIGIQFWVHWLQHDWIQTYKIPFILNCPCPTNKESQYCVPWTLVSIFHASEIIIDCIRSLNFFDITDISITFGQLLTKLTPIWRANDYKLPLCVSWFGNCHCIKFHKVVCPIWINIIY